MNNLLIIRDTYSQNATLGKLFVNGQFFCHTLEDTVRGHGIKVYGHTAIPAGEYSVKVSMSSRFKRLMPMIYTESNGYEIKKGGISFKGVRMHGGNTHLNTHGCVLTAFKRRSNTEVYETAEKELTELLNDSTWNLTVKNL